MPGALRTKLGAYLRLGRVSNLPTVWTNVLAGALLAGAAPSFGALAPRLVGVTLLYVAGMFLNDAFDWRFDARARRERPIPQGLVSVREVALAGAGMLLAGFLLVARSGPSAAWSGALLASAIVLYDAWHKENASAPALMGACRALVYVTAAMAVTSTASLTLLAAAGALLLYVVGLTHAARFETLRSVRTLWPLACLLAPIAIPSGRPLALFARGLLLGWIVLSVQLVRSGRPGAIGRAVARLIAGISLVDAAFLLDAGAIGWALLAAAGFPLTLALQRYVRGT
jgi:4-hydroxybenzoate polyprenyltransferase